MAPEHGAYRIDPNHTPSLLLLEKTGFVVRAPRWHWIGRELRMEEQKMTRHNQCLPGYFNTI